MSLLLIIEIISVLCNILYLILLTQKNIKAWFFGIAGASLGFYLMLNATLYGQAVIHIYYVAVGIYGWWHWNKQQTEKSFTEWRFMTHVIILFIAMAISFLTAWILDNYSDASNPWTDSFLTVFGFIASLMQARKIVSSWVYWLVIDAFSAMLFLQTELYIYALLMVAYSMMCIWGFVKWRKQSLS
jgi:nicotinamide mononucleotide transporter